MIFIKLIKPMFSKKTLFVALLVVLFVTAGVGCISFGGQSNGAVGMYRSSDKGEKWEGIFAFPTLQGVKSLAALKIYIVVRDPSDVGTMYVGSRGQGMYYTLDAGDSWDAVSFFNNKFIYGIAIDPKDKCNIYVSEGSHIYKSSDCTRTWQLMFTEERPGQRISDLAVDHNNPNTIYGSQINGDILRSTDAGKSWRIIKRFGFTVRNIIASPLVKDKTRLYVASRENGLFRSDDGGENWTDLSDGFKDFNQSLTYYRLILDPNKADSLYWVSKYGILRSSDAGKSWNQLSLLTPPGSVDIYSFTLNPANSNELYYTGTVTDGKKKNVRSTFYKTSDGGNNWVTRKLPTNTIPVFMSVHPKNSSVLYMGFATLES